jgi:general secretion pathway protein C
MVASASPAAAPELASRFKLIGVMAPKPAPGQPASDAGLALIAIDGKPARAFAPGARVDGEMVLQSVSLRTAAIGPAQGAAALTLEVPRLPAPATGTLAPVSNNAGPTAPRPAPPPAVPAAQPAPVPVPPPPSAQPSESAMPPQTGQQAPGQIPGQMPGMPPVPQRGTFTQ